MRAQARKRAASLVRGLPRVLHSEPDLECDLEMLDLTFGEMSTDFADLEPVKTRSVRPARCTATRMASSSPCVEVPTISDSPYT